MELNKKNRNAGRFLLAAAAVLWGLAGVCVKSITWGAMSQIAVRSFLSLLLLLAFKRSLRLRFTARNILGAVMMSLTGILYVLSIRLTTAGTAIVLQYIAPILVFLYAVLFQHRRPKAAEIVLTLAVFGGIVLSFADSIDGTRILGNLLGLASGVTFAAQIVIMNHESTDSRDSLIISCMLSLAVSVPFLFFDNALIFDAKNIFWLLMLGIFQYGLANALFGIGIQKVDKVEGSLILTIEPIFNPIPVAIICHETMGFLALLGSAVVIVCVTLYGLLPTIEERCRKKREQAR